MDGTVLVTGGTGTIGREIVRRLAAGSESPGIVVLSRAARDPDRVSTDDPLLDRLYAGPPAGPRVRVVRGDVRAADLGLSPRVHDELSREVTGVLHCAAETRFTLPIEEVRTTNVGGTVAVLDFAAGCRSLRRVGCLGTVYVAGRRIGFFAEDDVDDGDAGFVNSYERSKCEMEREVRRRMTDLPIALYRSSTVIGDSVTGAVTGVNSFHHALRLLYHGLAPMVPGLPGHRVDLVAVDYVADAVVRLFLHRFEPGRTYHLCSGPGRSAPLSALIETIMDAFHRFRPEWRRRGIEAPAIVRPETYELFVRSVEETGNEVLRSATRAVQSFAGQLACPKSFDAARAEAALRGTGIRPPPVLGYLPRIVRTCVETGWGARP